MDQNSGELQSDFDVFISYSTTDADMATKVCDSLEARELKCWIKPRNITAGNDESQAINQAIENSASLVIILSSAANESSAVQREVEQAVGFGKPVFSLRTEDVTPTETLQLFVSNAHWIDAWHGNLREHIDKIVNALQSLDEPLSTTSTATSSASRGSWFGVARRR